MWDQGLIVFAVGVVMVMAHEGAHIVTTRLLGGRWGGVEFKGYMLGVKLYVRSLSDTKIAWTLAAGPAAEGLVVAAAIWMRPQWLGWWLFMLGLQWVANLIPWGLVSNDGTRLWRIVRHNARH